MSPAIAEANLNAHLAIRERSAFTDQLGAVGCVDPYCFIIDEPLAAVRLETNHGRRRRGLLKAFAENHLAVNAAVDFVVNVFDARASQMRGYRVKQLICVNVDGDFLSVAGTGQD